MKKPYLALCALCLLALTGCETPAPEPSPSPTPTAVVTPSPTPTPTPEPTPEPTPTPVTEESIRADPAFTVGNSILDVIPAGDGYFVWYGPPGAALDAEGRSNTPSTLAWVDGESGETVVLPPVENDAIDRVAAPGPRQLTAYTAGASPSNGWPVPPVTYRFFMAEGNQLVVERDPWHSIARDLNLGLRRAAVVADARAGVNDLALVFVPPATEEGISEFITAATYLPEVTLRYDAEQGVLFLTLFDTVLDSGPLAEGCEDWVYDFLRDTGLEYPYATPAGSIGADNRFFTRAAISSNGKNTTVTLLLTEHAQQYSAQVEYLAEDMFPTLRLTFRETPPEFS